MHHQQWVLRLVLVALLALGLGHSTARAQGASFPILVGGDVGNLTITIMPSGGAPQNITLVRGGQVVQTSLSLPAGGYYYDFPGASGVSLPGTRIDRRYGSTYIIVPAGGAQIILVPPPAPLPVFSYQQQAYYQSYYPPPAYSGYGQFGEPPPPPMQALIDIGAFPGVPSYAASVCSGYGWCPRHRTYHQPYYHGGYQPWYPRYDY